MSSFAPPVSKLAESGIGVAAAPTGGRGLALGLDGKVPKEALVEAWRQVGAADQPAFQGTWGAFDAERPVQFFKDALGIVHLRGILASGTISTTAFTLPEGYRSTEGNRSYAIDANGAFGSIQIQANGNVVPTVGSTAAMHLHGISFRAT